MTGPTDVASWRKRITTTLSHGSRFAGLFASEDGRVVRALFITAHGATRLESVSTVDDSVPSIVDLAPAANWDEREAHDLYGVRFTGHDPLRPLVKHTADNSTWTVPVRGRDAYEVAVGPVHAGVIESGHFRFHVVGERILHLDARLFYKHRNLEKAAEGATFDEGMAYVGRACAGCAVANAVSYAQACEHALGLVAPPELRRARTVLIELERVWNHLNDIAAVCAGVGLAAGNNHFAALTERARRLNAVLTGHRFLFGTVRVGRSDLDLNDDHVQHAVTELGDLRAAAKTGWRELAFNASFQDRLPDIGIIDAETAEHLGTVGPAARAAGLTQDARMHARELMYDDFTPVAPERPVGDVGARLEQRALELWQSFDLLEDLLDAPITTTSAAPEGSQRPIGVGIVESPRGATSCVVERDGDRIARVHLRTGSYANWPTVAHAAADNLLPDFPLINKSFELCYACADR